jgi:hypothetical protein
MARSLLGGHLWGGRIRTSTALLILVFVITLVTYLLVRPVPASISNSRPPASTPAPDRSTTRAPQSPTPSVERSPTPSGSPSRPSGSPTTSASTQSGSPPPASGTATR